MGMFAVRGPTLVPAAGGYDNLANWPSAFNRASVSGSTISWIGPIGFGPSTANDVAQSHALTLQATPFTTSSNNQVVQYLDFTSDVFVQHTGVKFQACRFRGGSWVDISIEANGCLMEDCEFAANGTNFQGISRYTTYSPAGFTVRRCNVHGMENGVANNAANATIIDTWFHAFAGPDCDQIELYGGTSNVTIDHCTLDGRDTVSGFLNAGVNVTNFGGTVTGVSINNSRFLSVQNFAICDDDTQGGGLPLTWSVTNCGFRNNGSVRRGGTIPSPNSGNYTMASDDATSGTLINGTGVI